MSLHVRIVPNTNVTGNELHRVRNTSIRKCSLSVTITSPFSFHRSYLLVCIRGETRCTIHSIVQTWAPGLVQNELNSLSAFIRRVLRSQRHQCFFVTPILHLRYLCFRGLLFFCCWLSCLSQRTMPESSSREISPEEARHLRRKRQLDQIEIPEDQITVTDELLGRGGFGAVHIADFNGQNAAAKVRRELLEVQKE